jgi:hypothetical protein
MKTDVLIEQLPDHRYRATGSGRFAISVDGPTREAALSNFQRAVTALWPKNAEVVTVDIPIPEDAEPSHPWAWFAGIAVGDPLYPLFLEEIERNRQIDEENEARKLAEEKSAA